MERREEKGVIPQSARYPLFLLGLVVIIIGTLALRLVGGQWVLDAQVAAGVVGFALLVLAVAR